MKNPFKRAVDQALAKPVTTERMIALCASRDGRQQKRGHRLFHRANPGGRGGFQLGLKIMAFRIGSMKPGVELAARRLNELGRALAASKAAPLSAETQKARR